MEIIRSVHTKGETSKATNMEIKTQSYKHAAQWGIKKHIVVCALAAGGKLPPAASYARTMPAMKAASVQICRP